METAFSTLTTDREFDLIFPKDARKFSRMHWTPVAVAIRAAEWLAPRPGMKVLDVGSGSGKVCLIGAARTSGHFVGVERDGELVQVARDVAKRTKTERVRFIEADALTHDWSPYDAIYLFNPFANHVADEAEFVRVIAGATAKLAAIGPGKRVVTFHGFGGTMPDTFRPLDAEIIGPGVLQLWEKT